MLEDIKTDSESLPQEQILTVEEVSKWLRVTPMTIYRLIRNKDLPCYQIGRVKRIRKEDLHEYLNRSRTCGKEI